MTIYWKNLLNMIGIASVMLMVFVLFLSVTILVADEHGYPSQINQVIWTIIMSIASITIGFKIIK